MTTMKTNKWIAATVVACVGLAGLAVVLTWGQQDARALVREFGTWAAVVLAPLLTAWLTRDTDGDGTPDILDKTPAGPPGVALLLLVLALSAATQGCGTTAAQHRTLNTLTDIADPTYELALEGCDEARDFIVARQGSSEAEDTADMAAVNDACDTIVDGFEALRGTQLTAREWLDEGIEGGAAELVRQGVEQWQHLRALVERFQGIAGGES